jgi:hypothetical protein
MNTKIHKTKNIRLQKSSYFAIVKSVNPDFSLPLEKIAYSQVIGKRRKYFILENKTLFAEQLTHFVGIRDDIGYQSFYSDDPDAHKKIEYGHTLANTVFAEFVVFVDKTRVAASLDFINNALHKVCRKKDTELGLYTTDYLVALAFISELKSCMSMFSNGKVVVTENLSNSEMTHFSVRINFSIKKESREAEIHFSSDNDEIGYMSI